MENQESAVLPQVCRKPLKVKICGVGSAGIRILEPLVSAPPAGASCAAICADEAALGLSSAAEKVHLRFKPIRGLGTGGDPERGRLVAEEQMQELKALCQGMDVVLIVAGLGGGAGTGISPVLAKAAKAEGAVALAFVTRPFNFELGRHDAARKGLRVLKDSADGVVCLPNERILELVDGSATVSDAFKGANELLAEGLRGFCDLLSHSGLIEIHFEDVRALVHDRHGESTLAVAEAVGATRSREITDRLLKHPMLEEGQVLSKADVVLVSLKAGPDLTMEEVNRVVQDLGGRCEKAQVILGASIHEELQERLIVTVIAFRKESEAEKTEKAPAEKSESLSEHLLDRSGNSPRSASRFVPPAPSLSPEEMRRLLAGQRPGNGRRKNSAKMKQTQLPLDIVSKGRFDKSEPTIHKGEDLDLPTYLRRGVALN